MGRRARMSRYSRRKAMSGRSSRVWIIIVAVIAFLLLSVVVSVALGLALGKAAENYENNSVVKYDIGVEDYYSGDKRVKAVNAHEYSWGYGTSYYNSIGINDFSVCLRDSDGFITYHSAVDVTVGEGAGMGSRNLSDEVSGIHGNGGYVCAYFYTNALDEKDEYKKSILKAYEIALINEAAKSGVDEILVIGLDPTSKNIGEVEAFVSQLSLAAGKCALGVLVNSDDVKLTDNGEYLVPRVRAVCDFVALDMRNMPTDAASVKKGQEVSELEGFLSEMEYYIKSDSMRLVFSVNNSSLLDKSVKLGAGSVQIVE